MSSTQLAELPETQVAELAEAYATLTRLAEVGGPLALDARRSGFWRLAEADQKLPASPSVEVPESQLRLAATQYRVLIEQIPAVTFMASLAGDTNEVYVSPQIEALLGFTQAEWVGDPILWYKQTHPEDREWVSRDFANAVMTGQPFRGVLRVLTREGAIRWVQMEARFVRDEHGLPLFLQGAGFDVTDQFRAREAREQLVREQAARAEVERERLRLHEMFTTLPAAIVVVRGPAHVVEFSNPVASELAGAEADVIGKSWTEAFPEFGVDTASALDTVIVTGEPCVLREYRTRADRWGGERYFNVVFQPLAEPEGQGIRHLIYAVDVTAPVLARREIEQALQLRDEALAQSRETLKMREEFLSAVAHDLRTPIAAIKARAQLLNRQVTRMGLPHSDRFVESVTAIDSSATRMTEMIQELLDLARLQAGEPMLLERRPIDLVGLIRQTVADHQQQTRRHTIRLETSASELVGSWDLVRLRRVLGNLLDNAIKYSPEGGDILVTVGLDGRTPGYAMFQVQDFGLGMSEADLPRIFERFHRGANVVGRISGTGIGLNGSYHNVQAHGGTIDVESHEGAGSTFTVRLPVEEV